MKRLTALLTVCSLLLLPSCGKKESAGEKAPKRLSEAKEEQKPALPPGHPSVSRQMTTVHSTKVTKVSKPVKIPEEVERTWKFAVLAVVEKGTGKELLVKEVARGDV